MASISIDIPTQCLSLPGYEGGSVPTFTESMTAWTLLDEQNDFHETEPASVIEVHDGCPFQVKSDLSPAKFEPLTALPFGSWCRLYATRSAQHDQGGMRVSM